MVSASKGRKPQSKAYKRTPILQTSVSEPKIQKN